MNDRELLRYSRHILLPEIGFEGQSKLKESSALIIGAGGLGSPAAIYLAAGGVGKITLCDDDAVDLTNLQRQIVHRTQAVGEAKVLSAQRTLNELNPEIQVIGIESRASGRQLYDLAAECDLVIDASDNFATRCDANKVCLELSKPLVSGAAIGFQGQVTVFDFRKQTPCYGCLFPENGSGEEMSCSASGVFSPLVGIVGSVQAAEALKILMGIGDSLCGRLLLLDALSMRWREIRFEKDPHCPVCGATN